jgi:hypothetical protein
MSRLTAKQKGSLSALQSAAPCSRRAGKSPLPACQSSCAAPLAVSRRAFASDRALGNLDGSAAVSRHVGNTIRPRSLLTPQGFMMHLTIDASDVTELRRRIIGNCGDRVVFMRIQPLAHASKMRVWILLKKQEFDFIKQAIQSGLPSAEFGQTTEL